MNLFMKSFQSAMFVATVVLLIAVSLLPLSAGTPVDPSTLNPPPPPQFNPVCQKDGVQTICTVQFSDPPFAGGSGVICTSGGSSYEVFQFQNRSVQGHRYYDANGNLTRRLFHEVDSGTFTNPLNNNAVSFRGRGTTRHDLTTPGDINSGTLVVTGGFRIYAPHAGTVLIDVGRSVNAADGTLIRESGQHPIQDYFVFGDTAALQPLCEALQ